jgi:hypothetical protein
MELAVCSAPRTSRRQLPLPPPCGYASTEALDEDRKHRWHSNLSVGHCLCDRMMLGLRTRDNGGLPKVSPPVSSASSCIHQAIGAYLIRPAAARQTEAPAYFYRRGHFADRLRPPGPSPGFQEGLVC